MNSASSTLEKLSSQAREHYSKSVDPLAAKLMFSREPDPGTRRGRPLVLLIGNHSSGKSSLINYMLGQKVQNTGVAPTDDDFTVLSHSQSDDERDGDALVSNPDLGFAELRKFGPSLVSHLKLKARNAPFLEDLTLIDSRGIRFELDRGSMPYSAVIHPFPVPLRNGGTDSTIVAVQITLVSPISISTDPSAFLMKRRRILTVRSSLLFLPSCLAISFSNPPFSFSRRVPYTGRVFRLRHHQSAI